MKERNVSGLKQESEAIGNNRGLSPIVYFIKGEMPAWQGFWFVFVPALFGLAAIIMILNYFVWELLSLRSFHVFTAVCSAIVFLVMVVISHGSWRCAANTSNISMTIFVRIVVAVYIVWYGVKMVTIWFFLST